MTTEDIARGKALAFKEMRLNADTSHGANCKCEPCDVKRHIARAWIRGIVFHRTDSRQKANDAARDLDWLVREGNFSIALKKAATKDF